MIRKYEKPHARNLGEVIPTAEGACAAGSNVYNMSNGTCVGGNGATNQNNGCKTGNGASGAGCLTGNNPGPLTDCRNGHIAYE